MKLGQRVEILSNPYFAVEDNPKGEIVGLGHTTNNGKTYPIYIVKPDQGFYNSDHTIFVSLLVCHQDGLMPVNDSIPIA